MNRKNLFVRYPLFLCSFLMLAACSSDDEEAVKEPVKPQLPITIEVTETPYVNPDAAANGRATRAEITNNSRLSSFTMDYVYGATPSKGTLTTTKTAEGKWTAGGVWPAGGSVNVDWYAHTDGDFYLTDAEHLPYLDFKVDETAANQKDLLVASASGSYDGTGGRLSFKFDHACTALRFYVKKATNLNDYTLSVTNITLCNVKKTGEYVFSTKAWQSLDTNTNFTLYAGDAKVLGSSEYQLLNDSESGPWLFMIPQTLTAWNPTSALSDTYLQISCTITKDATTVFIGTAYIPFGSVLEKGYQHDVKINIGKNSLYSPANTKIIQ